MIRYDRYGGDSSCGLVKHPHFSENIWLSLKRSGGFLKLCFWRKKLGNTKFDTLTYLNLNTIIHVLQDTVFR